MQIETSVEALGLFKEFTFLQLKVFEAGGFQDMDEEEIVITKQALDLHRIYNSLKLEEAIEEKNKKENG